MGNARSLIIDNDYPKSDYFVQAMSFHKEKYNEREFINTLMRGAKEYGCVNSMLKIGQFSTQPHFGLPWLLEAVIRGSPSRVTTFLVMEIYAKARDKANPNPPIALITYWKKMEAKYEKWSDVTYNTYNIKVPDTKDLLTRRCAVCSKKDTDTLTLRQCIGCSMCCYCSEDCQLIDWEENNHKSECRQIKILNKYHKPYAKEIRQATIRGETHPALEKLRHKLGLSRPTEDYQELRDANTYEGKPIDPYEYVVAREDGTVWIGSTPAPIGTFSDTSTPAPPTPTTTFVHDEVPVLYGIGGNNRPSIQPGRKATIHNLQSKTSSHLNSTHCII